MKLILNNFVALFLGGLLTSNDFQINQRREKMKLTVRCAVWYIVLMGSVFLESAPIPPDIIAAIYASTITPELQAYVSVDSNLQNDTDSDGNSVLWLSSNNSTSSFVIQVFYINTSGFQTIVNKPNNFGILPLRASLGNPYAKQARAIIMQFLLRWGAVPN